MASRAGAVSSHRACSSLGRRRPSSRSGPFPQCPACPLLHPEQRPEPLPACPSYLSFPLFSFPSPLPLSSALHTLSAAHFGCSLDQAVFLRAPPRGRTRGDKIGRASCRD